MGEQMPKYHSFETVGDKGDTEGHVGENPKDHGEYFTVAGKCKMELFELWGTVSRIRKKKNRYLAAMLTELESVLPPEEYSKEYGMVRKVVLDYFNDYYRDIIRTLLGIEVEGQDYLN